MRPYRLLHGVLVGIFLGLLPGQGVKIPSVWAIASEQPGVADVFGEVDANCSSGWCGYFKDPNKTGLSYAAVAVAADLLCSGAFIGPNILMTASHCGGAQATPTSLTYLGTAVARPGTQTMSSWSPGVCNVVLGAIQQDPKPVWYRGAPDVQLFHCPDVLVRTQLVPPGLLLGDLDFDLREVTVNEPVYRLWWNTIMNRQNQSHLLISQGVITDTAGTYGFQNTPAYRANTCVNIGASGSPALSPTWQRILIGPLDSGGAEGPLPCSPGSRGAQAHSIFEAFYLDPGLYPFQSSPTTIANLGLSPALYAGWQDKDKNYVLDIQEDYERTRGEVRRDHYWYNFDSRHRNALWREFGSTQVFPDHVSPPGPPYGIVHLEATRSETLYRHDTFPLEAQATYRVSFKLLRVDSTGSAEALQFAFADPSLLPIPIPTRVSQTPTRVTFRFTTGASVKPSIRLNATAAIRADIQALSVIKEGSSMDFDTVDKRGSWRNQNTSGRALILPDGVTSSANAAPDFALALTRTSSVPLAADWSAVNEDLALVPGDCYRICFDKKSSQGTLNGRAEAVTGGGAMVGLSFSASSQGWQNRCLPTFEAQPNTRVRLGSRGASGEHILVDRMTLARQSPPCAAPAGCGSGLHNCNGECVSNQSINHCGNRCAPCPEPAHGGATCNGTSCGIACDSGYHSCGDRCIPRHMECP